MQYCTMKVGLNDITDEGFILKKADISTFAKYEGSMICFTLRKNVREDLNTVMFNNTLYLIDKRDGNYFECIAMEFIKCQN